MIKFEQVAPDRNYNGQAKINDIAHGRPSTIARTFDSGEGLTDWKLRMAVLGISQNEDLAQLASILSPADKDKLDRIVQTAIDRAGGNSASATGTAVHGVIEMILRGDKLDHVPTAIRNDAQAFITALDAHNLKAVASEVFVVVNDLKVAGTLDNLIQDEDGNTYVCDTKTSSKPKKPSQVAVAWSVQTAIYAHGKPWCADKGFVSWKSLGLKKPSREKAYVANIVQGSGECDLFEIDIIQGWARARLAMTVRAARRSRGLAKKV